MMSSDHHALLVVGERADARAVALRALNVDPIGTEAHPDIHTLIVEQLGIDEARALQRLAALRPVRAQRRIFITGCERMTQEAQNALLKLFEDPPRTAQFVLVVPSEDRLIGTLRSRLMSVGRDGSHTDTSLAEEFMALSYADRLAAIASHLKEKDDTWASQLLRQLEVCVHAEGPRAQAALADIASAAAYHGTRGASSKMLLEHVALAVPLASRGS